MTSEARFISQPVTLERIYEVNLHASVVLEAAREGVGALQS